VKNGLVTPVGFVTQDSGVAQGALSGTRIGVLKNDGNFYVREGSVSPVTGWVHQHANVSQAVLSGKPTRSAPRNGDRRRIATADPRPTRCWAQGMKST